MSYDPTPEERMPRPIEDKYFRKADYDAMVAWAKELSELPTTEEPKR